jgi:hypothetical protein
VTDHTRLKQMELAIATYNAVIRILKNQMKEGAADATGQAIAQYQEWRDNLDVEIALERIKQGSSPQRPRRKKRINGPPPQPTMPSVRPAIVKLMMRSIRRRARCRRTRIDTKRRRD